MHPMTLLLPLPELLKRATTPLAWPLCLRCLWPLVWLGPLNSLLRLKMATEVKQTLLVERRRVVRHFLRPYL